jgi:predicted RNase H-like HicB family nuclease
VSSFTQRHDALYAALTFKLILEQSRDGGHMVYVPGLRGCVSEGDTVEQAVSNIREASELYLEPEFKPLDEKVSALVRDLVL